MKYLSLLILLSLLGCMSTTKAIDQAIMNIQCNWNTKYSICLCGVRSITYGGNDVTSLTWVPDKVCKDNKEVKK